MMKRNNRRSGRRSYRRMISKEAREHPSFTTKQVKRIVLDHIKKKPVKKRFVDKQAEMDYYEKHGTLEELEERY